jgi:hypothetical protein
MFLCVWEESNVSINRDPNPLLRSGAQAYNRLCGLDCILEEHYVKVNEARARRIADAFDALPLVDSCNPLAALAYRAFVEEVSKQFMYLSDTLQITMEPWRAAGQPYANSDEMRRDVRDHRHLFFFTGGDIHPLMGHIEHESGLSATEMFRAVHDIFGHATEGFSFGPRGEENAWIAHSQMFTPLAQKAMTTETRGQNSWVNYGRQNYDAQGRSLEIPAACRPYPEQKGALLPDEFTDWREVLRESGIILSIERPCIL